MPLPREEASVVFESARKELLETGYFFPNFPICAKISDVHMGKQDREDDDGLCSKQYKSSGHLGAGLMMVWCVRHRECIGFTVLRKAESVKELYDIVSTRMRKMPKIIIYDNACNLFEVHRLFKSSMLSIEIQDCSQKLRFCAMEFTTRITPTARRRSIAWNMRL